MSPLKTFNASTLILTASGLALLGILTLEARPTSLPAGERRKRAIEWPVHCACERRQFFRRKQFDRDTTVD